MFTYHVLFSVEHKVDKFGKKKARLKVGGIHSLTKSLSELHEIQSVACS